MRGRRVGLRHPRAAQGPAGARRPPAPRLRRLGRRGGATRATSSSCAPRRARPTSSARRSTGRRCPTVLGTVAGDDTLIIVVAEDVGGATVATGCGPRRARLPAARPDRTEATREKTKKKQTMAKRVVLAYSGGLDTSVAVRWMIEELGVEVIALAVDVGQAGDDWDVVRDRARAAGAVEADRGRRRDEFAEDFVAPALKANAMYEGRYPLVSALSPAGDRQAPRRGGPPARRRRRRPRLHRQGQRPGPLRGVDPGARPRPRGDRPGPRRGA